MAIDVQITAADVTYAKTFLSEYLGNQMPEADFSEGTGLQDLLVKGMAYHYAFLRAELTKVKTLRSLKLLSGMTEDDEVNEAVDDIISNFFETRGTGSYASVAVTLVLSQSVDLFIGTDVRFNRDGVHNFVLAEAASIAKEDLTQKINTDGSTTYEISINLVADTVGADYNIAAGTFVSWDNFNAYVIAVRNDLVGSGGGSIEANTTYIARTNNAITVKNLVNPRAISTVLLEEFNDQGIKDVVTIGYGDPEMLRDKINTYVTWSLINVVHIGNHQDIYVSLPLIEDQTYISTTVTEVHLGEPNRDGSVKLPAIPIYKIHSVVDTNTGSALPYTLFIRDSRYFYTQEQEAYVVLTSGTNGVDITITYDTISGFSLVHNYLRNPEYRITLGNSLARAKIPIYIDMTVNYTHITGTPELDETAAAQDIITYVRSLNSTTPLAVDTIFKNLHITYSDYAIFKTPLIVKGTVIYPNGVSKDFYSENILTVPEYSSLGVTNRVCSYFTSTRYIRFVKLN